MTKSTYHPFKESLLFALSRLEQQGGVKNIVDKRDKVDVDYIIPIPQHPINDIRDVEPVTFDFDPRFPIPLPYFQRDDFPQVPHLLLNTGDRKYPCLLEAHFEQVALQWDADFYVRRLHEWLEKTSEGILHQEDQPLEHFLLGQGANLILPVEYLLKIDCVHLRKESYGETEVYYLEKTKNEGNTEYHVLKVDLGTHKHSGIIPSPDNLESLGEFFAQFNGQFDLFSWISESSKKIENYDKPLLIIVTACIEDEILGKSENRTYGFLCNATLKEVGLIGEIIGEKDDYIAPIFTPLNKDELRKISVIALSVHEQFNILTARATNGIDLFSTSYPVVAQVGVGAIGGQLARNLSQAGFAGRWKCIDYDILFPHNLSRWILADEIGKPKASILSESLNNLLKVKIGMVNDQLEEYSTPYLFKVTLGEVSDEMIRVLESSEVIIDSSASLTVQRMLDLIVQDERERFTIFLSPSGDGLSIFYSPADWGNNHTVLEISFYKALIKNNELHTFLQHSNNVFSYSGDSCRALSTQISTHKIAMFSSIASGIIEKLYKGESPQVIIFNLENDFSTSRKSIHIEEFISIEPKWEEDIKLKISTTLFEEVKSARTATLPNETGGVLIGSFDIVSKTLFVVDQIEAPIDSTQTPSTFHRGMKGINERLDQINEITHNNLYYIGEWHSHPSGVPPWPSKLDEKLLHWLRTERGSQIYPYLMLIIGDNGDFTILF